jgi:hypothetical protein
MVAHWKARKSISNGERRLDDFSDIGFFLQIARPDAR